ncbi:MAG: hypothetical protein AAB037_06575 [Chloroflexota bacterium]
MNQEPIAHTSDDGRAQFLYDHLTGTAKLAAEMAAEFGCSGWGYLARVTVTTPGLYAAPNRFWKGSAAKLDSNK